MASKQTPINLKQGDSHALVLRVETDPIVYKTITAIQQSAPLRIEAVGHGLINGQNAAVTNVKGMTEINGTANDLQPGDWHPVTVVDADTIEFNDVNGAGFKAYVSGGVLQYNTLMDLTGWDARLQVRNKKGGDEILLEMTTANGLLAIDTALRTVTIYFDAIDLTGITWKKGYYDLELFKDVVRGGQTIEQVYSPIEGPITTELDTTK